MCTGHPPARRFRTRDDVELRPPESVLFSPIFVDRLQVCIRWAFVIDVVLPALDEADALAWVLPRMPEGFRAIVVDNGSSDGTPAVAHRLGATVVAETRPGFGAACWRGLT